MQESSLFFSFFFLAVPRVLQDLSSRPEIKPVPPAVEGQSPNHWTAREVPGLFLLDVPGVREAWGRKTAPSAAEPGGGRLFVLHQLVAASAGVKGGW